MADNITVPAMTGADNEGFINHPHIREEGGTLDNATASQGIGGNLRDFASKVSTSASGIASRLRHVPANSRQLIGRVDTHARSNPWLHIGLAGTGALLIGFVVGRTYSRRNVEVARGYDFDQAMDE